MFWNPIPCWEPNEVEIGLLIVQDSLGVGSALWKRFQVLVLLSCILRA